MPKFNIGQEVYWARIEGKEKAIECLECRGKRFLTVILGDGEQVTIECAGCARGYDLPTGFMRLHVYAPSVTLTTINRVEIAAEELAEYGVNGSYRVKEDCLFLDKAEAETKARQLSDELTRSEEEAIHRKKKPTRTWAWNVHYHRAEIRRAKESIEYNERKLAAALPHMKAEKAGV